MNTIESYKFKKRMIIIIIALLMVLVSMLVVVSVVLNKNNSEEIILEYDSLKTIEDVVNYYRCKFISEEISEDENYDIDVYLEFCMPLYEEEESNETFYNNIIKDIARIAAYRDLRLIDEKNDIKIEVICEDYKIYNIIINGIEDYFIYMDSLLSLRKYKEIETTEFFINSPIIVDAINNNWSKDINLGTRDSIYNQYNIYNDEGIKVRNIDSRIYNIIFTKKYQGAVVNDITPGMTFFSIEQMLGKPTFEDKSLEIIGYKGTNFYVFFTKDEISVYRLENLDTTGFFELVDTFLNEEIDFLEMMNKLTYLWPDYSDYDYTASEVFLSYPHRGIDVKINYDDTTGIIIYNNFNSDLSNIEKYLENTEFMGLLQVDNISEAEKRRVKEINKEKEGLEKYKNENTTQGYESTIYDCYPIIDEEQNSIVQMKFISENIDMPNREINDSMSSFLWINDVYFVFSKANRGIYLYDLNTGIISGIVTGDSEYQLKSFDNGILKFDEEEVLLQF